MGASAREIEQEIRQTRDRMDQNLTVLEQRAASNARRVGKIVAVAVGAVAGMVGGFLLYRRLRRPKVRDRLKGMFTARARDLPSVKVTVEGKNEEPGAVGTIVRNVAPALVVTASTALLKRIGRPREETRT